MTYEQHETIHLEDAANSMMGDCAHFSLDAGWRTIKIPNKSVGFVILEINDEDDMSLMFDMTPEQARILGNHLLELADKVENEVSL
jgi:hypothetical protein